MKLTCSLSMTLMAGLTGFIFSHSAFASDPQSCGVDQAVAQFSQATSDAIQILPALDADIDKCFNPAHTDYNKSTHSILRSTSGEYQRSQSELKAAYSGLQRGQAAGQFIAVTLQVAQRIAAISQPIFQNASNLTRYGFVTSDAQTGGAYKYPQCNSRVNDNPAGQFARVYNDILLAQQSAQQLAKLSACLQQ